MMIISFFKKKKYCFDQSINNQFFEKEEHKGYTNAYLKIIIKAISDFQK